MAIYHTIVFGILISEIVGLVALMIPFPANLKHKTLKLVKEQIINRSQYTIGLVGIFIFIIFMDSVNNLRVAMEKHEEVDQGVDLRLDTSITVKKFYAQRNAYLTGGTMFLSFILNYTIDLLIEVLSVQLELYSFESQSPNGSALTKQYEDQVNEIERLSIELKLVQDKTSEFKNLQEKVKVQQDEYDSMLTEVESMKINGKIEEVTLDE